MKELNSIRPKKSLSHIFETEVKFSEADPLGIVWHGHFIRYFEDGREAFGQKFGLKYLDFYRQNIVVPIIKINCDYKRILRYGHRVRLETVYHDCAAAKLLFDYNVFDAHTEELVASGKSTQVFMDRESMELMLTVPQFMLDWKEKWLQK
ncbi:MAG: acyl-CoA thioesterase [Bacteroidetes bacterium]|nr:acyl-CoA thioesterase [Bacteroidota bacterium]